MTNGFPPMAHFDFASLAADFHLAALIENEQMKF
jgi:hypothetical protein